MYKPMNVNANDRFRLQLHEELVRYGERYPNEAHTTQRMLEFIARRPDCFERTCTEGHITGSAWIVNTAGTHVLLTHHRKLDKWLQLGGHADGHGNVMEVALKEAEEESGMHGGFEAVTAEVFDIDIHRIPARASDPEHLHYDVRYVLRTPMATPVVSEESHDVQWVPLAMLDAYTTEHSMLRMATKWERIREEGEQGAPGAPL